MSDWVNILSIILNVGLGGGLIVTIATLRSVKKKSSNEAKSIELENIQQALTIWRQTSEQQKKERDLLFEKINDLTGQVDSLKKEVISLRSEVKRLKTVNSRILSLLEKIDAENYQKIVEEIKKEIEGAKV